MFARASHSTKQVLSRVGTMQNATVAATTASLHTAVPLNQQNSTEGISFVRSLFCGEVPSRQIVPFPRALTQDETETLKMLADPVKKFFDEQVDSAALDKAAAIPDDVMQGLKDMGLFGLQIPTEYEGLGLSNSAYARIAEEVVFDGGIAVTLMAHQSIGLKGILLDGTPEQKKKYLPKLASGEHVAAFALTEPSSGSDANSIRTKATLSEDGKHWVLNGSKIWISNGGTAEVFTVFAQTEVDGKQKVTAFIVERSFGGLTNGAPESKLGIKASNTAEVYFDDCKVPVENVLGEVGGGFKIAMRILNNGRFGIGAGASANIRRLIGMASEHAINRKQFGLPIKDFGLIEEKFAQMAVNAYAIESMTYCTTGMIDNGVEDCSVEAACCKVFGSEALFNAINESLQVHGGMGFMTSAPYERMLRDSRILSIFEGTNEILRLYIALSGAKVPGERLQGVAKLAKKLPGSAKELGNEVLTRIKRRTWQPEPLSNIHSSLSSAKKTFERSVGAFAFEVDRLLYTHGKNILEPSHQLQLKRVADVAIDLYGMSSTLSRCTTSINEGLASAEHEVKLVNAFADQAGRRVKANLGLLAKGEKKNGDKNLSSIAKDIFSNGKHIPPHPLGV